MKLVLYPAFEPARLRVLAAIDPELELVNVEDQAAAVQEIISAEGLIGRISPAMLAAAARLRWVQSPTASLEHYMFPELIDHPVQLTNMRGLFSDVIADHVLGYILCFARNLHLYVRRQMEQRWEPCGGEQERTGNAQGPSQVTAMDRAHLHLADQTLGVIGLGEIGREIARRAFAFGMQVLAVEPKAEQPPAEVARVFPPEQVEHVLRASDFVVVAAPHTPSTVGWFGDRLFAAMKPTAHFINVGRGAIVQTKSLRAALQQQRLAGAALDVFEHEPLPADDPLWRMPNVIITPHVAACSPRIAERHLQTLAENVRRFARGEPLLNVVDKNLWC